MSHTQPITFLNNTVLPVMQSRKFVSVPSGRSRNHSGTKEAQSSNTKQPVQPACSRVHISRFTIQLTLENLCNSWRVALGVCQSMALMAVLATKGCKGREEKKRQQPQTDAARLMLPHTDNSTASTAKPHLQPLKPKGDKENHTTNPATQHHISIPIIISSASQTLPTPTASQAANTVPPTTPTSASSQPGTKSTHQRPPHTLSTTITSNATGCV